jgi:hypothetical protein
MSRHDDLSVYGNHALHTMIYVYISPYFLALDAVTHQASFPG